MTSAPSNGKWSDMAIVLKAWVVLYVLVPLGPVVGLTWILMGIQAVPAAVCLLLAVALFCTLVHLALWWCWGGRIW